MALRRACRDTWILFILCSIFVSPLVALGESENVGGDVTCPADQVTCGGDGEIVNSEGGGARYVLGLRPQRLTAVPGAAEVHISVKTAAKYHAERLSILLLTWLQTVEPYQVYIITDDGAEDEWTTTATQHGFRVRRAEGCEVGHCSGCLCCKSGAEYEQFYKETESGSHYKWFCHVDDDVYVNTQQLVHLLSSYDPQREKAYLGRWSLARTSKIEIPPYKAKNIPHLKTTRFGFGTGAFYCLSSALMTELEPYLRGSDKFLSTCKLFGYTDDMTIGATIEAMLGHNLTDVDLIVSQLHAPGNIPASRLPKMVSISYGQITLPGGEIIKRRVTIPQPKFTVDQDPTRFLSYHCLIYPETSWCH